MTQQNESPLFDSNLFKFYPESDTFVTFKEMLGLSPCAPMPANFTIKHNEINIDVSFMVVNWDEYVYKCSGGFVLIEGKSRQFTVLVYSYKTFRRKVTLNPQTKIIRVYDKNGAGGVEMSIGPGKMWKKVSESLGAKLRKIERETLLESHFNFTKNELLEIFDFSKDLDAVRYEEYHNGPTIEPINRLLDGHRVKKITASSGSEYRSTKKNKNSKPQYASKEWLIKNVSNTDMELLIKGESVGVPIRKGRGFSYVDLEREPIK